MLENLKNHPNGINEIKLKTLLEIRKKSKNPESFRSLFPPVEIGSITLVDQIVILSLLQIINAKKVIEIGTSLGYTTALLAMNTSDTEIHTIDLPKNGSIDQYKFSSENILTNDSDNDNYLINNQYTHGEIYLSNLSKSEISRINLIKKDSKELVFKEYFGNADFIFIDGGHDFETIEKDTINSRSILKNGVIIWHDFNSNIHSDVTTYLKQQKNHKIFHVAGSLCAFEIIGI